MTGPDPQHDPQAIERLLAEWAQLDQAGVFQRTPVDLARLAVMARPAAHSPWRRWLIGLQAAACLALVVGLSSWWWASSKTSNLPGPVGPMVHSGSTTGPAAAGFQHCLNGPASGSLSSDCRGADYDLDGDVDLADYGAYQRVGGW